MRIALFSEVYWPMVSGVGVTLLRLTEALQARGHQVRVYSPRYALPAGLADRPEVHRSASLPLPLYPDVQWAFPRTRELLDDAAEFAPDLIHVATEFALGVSGLRIARALDLPVVATAHTDYERYAGRYGLDWLLRSGWRYLRWFYGRAERVLCPSEIYAAHLRNRGIMHAGVWSRGVDPRIFHPRFRSAEFRHRVGAGPDQLLVTYIGRLAREKNLLLLLDAWQKLDLATRGARLVLVGGGPLEPVLRRRRIPGVHLTGLLQGHELSAAYASADLFAFPSTTETFGNVVLEAMASGLPVLLADSGGVLELARHGDNAWLVPPDNAGALANGLELLAADQPLRHRLASGALRTAAERDWGRIYDGLLMEYQAVLRNGRFRRAA